MRVKEFTEADLGVFHSLEEKEVHLWLIRWPDIESIILEHWNLLEGSEKREVSKLRNQEDRMRSGAGRIITKMLLAQYLKVANSDIKIVKGKFGKPGMKRIKGKELLKYSVSHSVAMVVIAVTKNLTVGVDTEIVRAFPEYKEIAGNFFTKKESEAICKSQNAELFFYYWTAKEAYVKALGLGLQKSLNSFSVQVGHIVEGGKLRSDWQVISGKDQTEYATTIAVKSKGGSRCIRTYATKKILANTKIWRAGSVLPSENNWKPGRSNIKER